MRPGVVSVVPGVIVSAALATLITSATAAPRLPRIPPAARLEEPCLEGTAPACTRRPLDAFTAALSAHRAGTATHPLRVSWFGDSLTADDQITHALRTKLAALVGDGGPGFLYAVSPHPFNQHRVAARSVTGPWRVHGVSASPAPDRLLGLGGSAHLTGEGDGAIRLTAHTPIERVDVHYLAQPHGGALEVVVDGQVVATLATAAERKQAMFAPVELPAPATRVVLRAHGRVRLFGAALERRTGAVVDNLGVVNATAKQLRTTNLPAHWQNQLAHRAPDLVVLMLGTNEAGWLGAHSTGMAEHEKLFGELLASVRSGAPGASCLVVSPLDQLDWRLEGMPARASIPVMVEAQRRMALAHGCAFWDVYAWMGGEGASKLWFQRGLVMKDFTHPTAAGATRLGDALFTALTGASLQARAGGGEDALGRGELDPQLDGRVVGAAHQLDREHAVPPARRDQ